jgi:bifunctional non-homologous end joining protein LigD
MREALKKLGLESFPMATGGKGIHVVVPLKPERDWDMVKDFAEAIAHMFAEEKPERYLAKASKAERRGKIFVDYLRNGRGSTAIAPFSSRARPGAPVAWPLSWASLGRLKNARPATVETALAMLKRQKSDPWDGYFAAKQSLPRI